MYKLCVRHISLEGETDDTWNDPDAFQSCAPVQRRVGVSVAYGREMDWVLHALVFLLLFLACAVSGF